jgi:hypothetical protein
MAADYLSGTVNAPGSTTTQAAYRPSGVTGSSLHVVKTGGMNAIMRDNPGGTQIASYPEGSSLTLVSTTAKEAGGREWKNVRGPDGKSGWMASFLLSGDASTAIANTSTNSSSSLLASRSPFTLTSDMRARALAARARAVPLSATGSSTTEDKKTVDTSKQSDTKSASSSSSKPTSSSTSSSASKTTSSTSTSKKP